MKNYLHIVAMLLFSSQFLLGQGAISIEKNINGVSADNPLDLVVLVPNPAPTLAYSFVVQNTGTLNLSNVVVTDAELGAICTIPTLAVGSSQTCTLNAPAALGLHSATATATAQPLDAGGNPTGGPVTATDGGIYTGVFIEVERTSAATVCANTPSPVTAKLTMLGGSPGVSIRNIALQDVALATVNLSPNGPFWTGGDLNGNGFLDFIDSNSDGISDEVFVWNFSQTYLTTITATLNGSGGVWAANLVGNATNVDQTTVTVNPAPSASITGNNSICAGGSTIFTASGGGTYLWNSTATTASISVSNGGIYAVTVTNAGCTATATRTLTVNPLPSASITGNNVICTGGITTFTASGGGSYLWNNGQTTTSINVSLPLTYRVTVTNAAGCTASSTRQLLNNPLPTPTITGDTYLCPFSSELLTATGGGTYLWSNGQTTTTITATTVGPFTVTVTDANGCTASSSRTLIAGQTPITATVVTPVNCTNSSSGAINLQVTGGTGIYETIWSNGSASEDLTSLTAGQYCVTVNNSQGCSTVTCVVVPSTGPDLEATITHADCPNGTNGAIALNVTSGQAPYLFDWEDLPGTNDPQNRSNLSVGLYTLTITDATGCTGIHTWMVTNNVTWTIEASTTNTGCFGTINGAVDITIANGSGSYSYFWGDGSTAEDRTGLAAQTTSVTVSDAQGCLASKEIVIGQSAPIEIQVVSTDPLCFGGSNGSITLAASGGTPIYLYDWADLADTNNAQNRTGLVAGTYTVTVSDANLCTQVAAIAVKQPNQINPLFSVTNLLCFGGTNGAIDLTPIGGTPGYTYLWSTGSTTEDISGLSSQLYTVTVTDAIGCTRAISILPTQPNPIVLTTTTTNISCFGGNNGSILMTVAGGVSPYSFLWSNSSTLCDIFNVSAGTYTVTVTDANGCTKTTSATVLQPPPLSLTVTKTNVTCFGGNNGSINLSVTGGTPGYTYSWSNPSNTQNPSGLTAGTYCVTVTDVNGCTTSTCVTITQPSSFLVATSLKFDATCEEPSGFISLSTTGGTTPYSYNWSDIPGSNDPKDRNSLAAGTYTVTVTDANGCTTSNTQNIIQLGTPVITTTQTNATCFATYSGTVNLSLSGSFPNATYGWSDGFTMKDRTNLLAGVYCVVLTVGPNCTATACVTITQPPQFTANPVKTDANCGFTNGSIALSPSGGVSPYITDWADLPGTNNIEDRINLAPGVYTATVTDGNGCSTIVTESVESVGSQIITATVTNVPCNGFSVGAIDITVTNGVAPYSFLWINGVTTEDITSLSVGQYCVTVTGSDGCSKVFCTTISENAPIVVTGTTTNVTCFGGADGSIDITVTGGTAPYTYLWSNNATTEDTNNMTAGTYTVTVTDINACTSSAQFTILQPNPIQITFSPTNINCAGSNSGSVSVVVTGGTPVYSYNWSNGATTQNINNLAAGQYCLTVTDANGCTRSNCFTILSAPPILISASIVQVSCFGGSNGSINVIVSGGTLPYTFDWSHLSGAANPEDVVGLNAGTYTVTVTDANGCTLIQTFPVAEPTPFIIDIDLCDNLAFVQPIGGIPPFTYLWSNNNQGSSGGFLPGTYTVTVTAAGGCTTAETFVISPNPTPCTRIVGHIISDENSDCTADPTEPGVANWFVKAESASQTFYGTTDDNGAYTIRVAPGANYNVTIATPIPSGANICAPTSVSVSLPQVGDVATADFEVQNLPACPLLTVDLASTFLRRCNTGNYYQLNWVNQTPVPVNNAYIHLQLDPAMNFISSTLPATTLGSNLIRFDLNNLAPYQSGQFTVQVGVSCNAVLGQTHCTTATIFPNGPCNPSPAWTGAQIAVRSVCTNDSLHFILKNIGTGPMSSGLEYIVIEDGIMTLQQLGNPLVEGDSMVVQVPADGSTWRIEAAQEVTYPGQSQPVLSVEGCTTTGTFTTGFVQQFPTGALDPWEETLCIANVGSYDPNDKQGLPLGYGPTHYIRPRTEIDYRIRFQNTGTDTAFAVVIRDTLSPWLDPVSIRPGASSHPYHFEFGGENVIVFDFPGIMLPDSNANVEGSQGFVQFKITPRASTPLETDVFNTAAIYFDFNEPIITNATQHRIGLNFVTVNLWEPIQPQVRIQVAPNPMLTAADIRIVGLPPGKEGLFELRIFDLLGRNIVNTTSSAPQFTFQRNGLPAGNYLFNISLDGGLLGSGKLIIAE